MRFRDNIARDRAHGRYLRRQVAYTRNPLTRYDHMPANALRLAEYRLARARHENRVALGAAMVTF